VNSLTFNSTFSFPNTALGFQFFGSSSTNFTARNLTIGAGGITMNPGAASVVIGPTNNIYGNVGIAVGTSQTWLNNSVNSFTLKASNAAPSVTTILTIGSGQTLTFAGSGTMAIGNATASNQLANIAGSGNIVVNKSGIGGQLQLWGTNVGFSGNVTLNSGVLQLDHPAALGNGGTLTINGGWLDCGSGITVTNNRYNNAQSWNGDFGYIGSGTLGLGTGAVTLGATRQLTIRSTLDVAGVISDGGSGYGLIKLGDGTLKLDGANTFTGPISIGAGTVQLNAGVGGSLPSSTALTFNYAGQFTYDNASATNAKSQTIQSLTVKSNADAVIMMSRTVNTNLTLTFNTAPSRAAGATILYAWGNNGVTTTNATNLIMNFPALSSGFVDQGTFVSMGNSSTTPSFCWMTNNGTFTYPRPVLYGVDPGAVVGPGGTSLTGTDHRLITNGVVTAQNTATFKTITISNDFTHNTASYGITNAGGATLTVNGINKVGAAVTMNFSGGNGFQADTDQELVIRDGGADNIIFHDTDILANGNNAFVKTGSGIVTIGVNAYCDYTGDTYVNAGTLRVDPNGFLPNTGLHMGYGSTIDANNLFTSGSTFTLPSTSLTLSDSYVGNAGATWKAAFSAPANGTFDIGSIPITMNYDGGLTPAIGVQSGALSLNGNAFKINNNSYLPDGVYTLITNVGFNIVSSGTFTVSGTAIDPAKRTSVVAVGNRVVLTVNGPLFSNLSASQTINHGASAVTLGGKVSDANGPVYPAMGDPVYVTIGGITQSTTINDNTGDFSFTFNPTWVPGGTNAIIYSYLGNPGLQLSGTSDSSTTLTNTQVATSIGLTSSKNPSHTLQSVFFTATLPADATGNNNSSNSVTFKTNGVAFGASSGRVPVTGSLGTMISASATNLAVGSYTITAEWPGDNSYFGSTNTITQVVNANQAPIASNTNYTRSAGVYQLNIPTNSLMSNASEPDGDPMTLTVGVSTNGITPIINNGNVVYTNANNVADKFTYTVNDGYGLSATATVFVNLDTTAVFGQASPLIDTTAGPPTLTFAGIPGYSYSIQRADDLGFTVNVTTILTTNAPASGVFHFTDNSAPSPQAFYRLQWNP
jgi:autotransporter-associated beta strand protein